MPAPFRSIATVLACAVVSAFAAEEWKVPAEAAAVANPVKVTDAAVAAGQKSYGQFCQMCHGATGKGDGEAAAALTPKPASFGSPAVAGQSDGALFHKITVGRGAMAPWKDVLTAEQRWQVVIYLRSLVAKPAGK